MSGEREDCLTKQMVQIHWYGWDS